jgi:hypothetical protein
MRLTVFISVLLLGCSLAAMAKDVPLEESIKNAQAAPLKDQPRLYVKIAQDQLRVADKSYLAANPENGRSAVANIAEYAGKATEASIQSNSKLKNTEIDIRKIADKLRDIKRNLNFDDQGPVQSAIDKLEEMRGRLLKHMFEAKKK